MIKKSHHPHRSALRHGRVSELGYAYFITKCTLDKGTNVLVRQDCAEIIIESLNWLKDHHIAHVCGFVIMPNHYHTVLGLADDKTLSQTVESVSKYTARRINRILGQIGKFWEEGFYDHCIREQRDYDDILEYMHGNPARNGLTEYPGSWPYSTANPKYAQLIDWEWLGPNLRS